MSGTVPIGCLPHYCTVGVIATSVHCLPYVHAISLYKLYLVHDYVHTRDMIVSTHCVYAMRETL